MQVSAYLKLSIAVAVATIALKTGAWWLTDSVGLLSDALESLVNLAGATFALMMVTVAALPPDEDHPYGHHKAELFSAILEGVMIILASLLILRAAWIGWFDAKPLLAPLNGLLVNGAASVLNGLWCWILLREGRRLRSPALSADGRTLILNRRIAEGDIWMLPLE